MSLRGRIVLGIACALALTAVFGCTPRPALQFSPATLPDAQVGSSYAATITVSQAVTPVGGASVQDGALPAGLDLALAKEPEDTIQISGTPTVAGTFSLMLVRSIGVRPGSGAARAPIQPVKGQRAASD